MAQKEHTSITNDVRLECSGEDVKIFLNSTGKAYTLESVINLLDKIEDFKMGVCLSGKAAELFNEICEAVTKLRIITYGLAIGGSDLIAIVKKEITPDMIGKKVGIFCGIEIKTEKDDLRKEQKNFMDMVIDMGGLAGVARSPNHIQEAINIIQG